LVVGVIAANSDTSSTSNSGVSGHLITGTSFTF
jgi:hypothetical protein